MAAADGADGLDSEIVAAYFVPHGGGDVMEQLLWCHRRSIAIMVVEGVAAARTLAARGGRRQGGQP